MREDPARVAREEDADHEDRAADVYPVAAYVPLSGAGGNAKHDAAHGEGPGCPMVVVLWEGAD